LNYQTTQTELETLFAEAGDVLEVFVPTDRNTGRPRGFAFVEFADESAVARAIEELDGREVGGRQIRVNEAQERPRRPPMPSPGGPPFERGGGGPRPKPKGSRRNLRGKKRSL
jgi:RNA recognition motif-containing protein